MLLIRTLLSLVLLTLSGSLFGFELAQWQGVWERYSPTGQLEERISADEVIAGKMLSSKIEYYKDGKPVGEGVSLMSDLKGNIRASMHFTNGMQIELRTLHRDDSSVFFHLTRHNLASGEKTAEMYTRFRFLCKEDKVILRQDLFEDKAQRKKLLSVNFYKKS